ncbi:hypothetical protein JN01_0211 [Entomoplasma freundtii]|uniref:Uncharacterized protein n=1 Tax=Entomoplasma freundtii TaxID=74700 RepID=A0A2K8NTS1_9MOLU|nr:hypothetical protein [Entomoplasma freundtii]ATZ16578.1 hypothetical protein EFREU_v1c05570 [Entomoplasma freundtii]TDY58256.1 hypothetical protein JN01_0211 [Entomoplasma freundtii]
MTALTWINLVLWILDLCVVVGISGFYLWFAKWYHDWKVLEINSGHDLIDSHTMGQLVETFQKKLNLTNYVIEFQDNDYERRLFWNLKRREKKIIITKRIFPSVGYELDYLISRLWIASKELEHNRLLITYKWVVKFLPYLYLALIGLCFIGQTVVFFLGLNQQEVLSNSALDFLWTNPIFAFLVFIFFALWVFNFYIAFDLKTKVEQLYNKEVVPLVKEILDFYTFDFFAARQYAQEMRLPYAFTFRNRLDKWLGPFVY